MASYVLTIYGQHDKSIYGERERETMRRKREGMGKIEIMDKKKGVYVAGFMSGSVPCLLSAEGKVAK